MQTGHELQSLPESILARIFMFTDLIQDDAIALPMARDFIDDNNMALLFVSYRIHQLALRMFWSANNFSIRIEKFDAAAILPWWTHVNAVRTGIEQKRIFMADPKTNNFVNADLTPVQNILDPYFDPEDDDSDDKWDAHQEFKLHHEFKIHRTAKPWSITRVPRGTITLDVPYEPHWLNLKEWLYLFHKGDVPALTSSDIGSGQQEWKDLHQIVGLFLSVQREKGGSWENVEKSLEGWQYTLKFADFRWRFEEGEDPAQEIEDTDGDMDEGDADGEYQDGEDQDSASEDVAPKQDEDESMDEYGGQESEDLLDQLTHDLNTQTPAATGNLGCDSTQTLQSSPPSRVARGRYDYFSSGNSESGEEELQEDVKPKIRTSSPEL